MGLGELGNWKGCGKLVVPGKLDFGSDTSVPQSDVLGGPQGLLSDSSRVSAQQQMARS